MHLETAANLCASWRQEIEYIFFAIKRFEMEGITKHLMTGPTGNSEVYLKVSGNKTHCFPGKPSFICHPHCNTCTYKDDPLKTGK